MKEELYMIYGSYQKGRFKAMDMNQGVQVNNLIYATIYYPEAVSKLEKEISDLEKVNPDWKFEIRRK